MTAIHARRALAAPVGTPRWYAAAEQSVTSYAPRSAYVRRLMFGQIAGELEALRGARRGATMSFVERHGFESLDVYPHDGRLYHAVLGVLQAEAALPEDLDRLDPYLEQLLRVAPARAGTHQLLAIQALRRGRCEAARRIIHEYTTRIPEAAPAFTRLIGVVEALDPSRCHDRDAGP